MPLTSKSVEKNLKKRETVLDNRINRRFKEKFNQSLISHSKEKIQHQRSRINSSVNGCKRELQGISTMLLEEVSLKGKKEGKKTCSQVIRGDPSKIIKARRL